MMSLLPCEQDIYDNGIAVAMITGMTRHITAQETENMIKRIAKETNTKTDWHTVAGRSIIRVLGNEEDQQKVINALKEENLGNNICFDF